MVEIFKEWIESILCVGILFTIIRIIVPNSNLKKYTYSLIGIITIIVIVSPVIKFFSNPDLTNLKAIFTGVEDKINENIVYTKISNYEEVNKNNVKENFKEKLEEDVKSRLKADINVDAKVIVDITESYNINSIEVHLKDTPQKDILSFLSQEYDISKDKIKINKGE